MDICTLICAILFNSLTIQTFGAAIPDGIPVFYFSLFRAIVGAQSRMKLPELSRSIGYGRKIPQT